MKGGVKGRHVVSTLSGRLSGGHRSEVLSESGGRGMAKVRVATSPATLACGGVRVREKSQRSTVPCSVSRRRQSGEVCRTVADRRIRPKGQQVSRCVTNCEGGGRVVSRHREAATFVA